jgi:hypothetical protein
LRFLNILDIAAFNAFRGNKKGYQEAGAPKGALSLNFLAFFRPLEI